MFKKIYNKVFPILLLLFQPLIDSITSIMLHFNINITIGLIIKIIFIFLCLVYLIFIDKKKYNIVFIVVLIFFSLINIICNIGVIKVSLFQYAGYMIKYIYLIVVYYFFIRWFKNKNKMEWTKFRIPILIVFSIFLVSIATNTSFSSYSGNRRGICGWYNSANELGALLSLFFPITIYNAFHNTNRKKIDIFIFLSCAIMLILVGTKTGFLSFLMTLLFYIFYRIIFIKKFKLNFQILLCIALLIIPFFFFDNIPAVYNFNTKMSEKNIVAVDSDNINSLLLSGRDNFNLKAKDYRKNINFISDLFGKSYLKDNNIIFIVERDILDIRYMYGIIGIISLFCLLIYSYYKYLSFFFHNFKVNIFNLKLILCVFSMTIVLGISYVSGHVLLSPSVSTFLILLLSMCGNLNNNFEITLKNRTKI